MYVRQFVRSAVALTACVRCTGFCASSHNFDFIPEFQFPNSPVRNQS